MICLRMEKTYIAKTPSGDFKVTTPENPLLSKQAVTSKGIPVPYTNLKLNAHPNTCSVVTISHFQCTTPSTWLTNCAVLGHMCFHLLGTYVTILCNWLIFWQKTPYLYFGRSKMCLILQETLFQDQVLKSSSLSKK